MEIERDMPSFDVGLRESQSVLFFVGMLVKNSRLCTRTFDTHFDEYQTKVWSG